MEMRQLGASGLKVPVLCLGAMTFGEADTTSMMHGIGSPEDEVGRILERCLDAGVNFIDTADIYGQDGLSERVLGRWFARTGHRDRVILATKFRFGMPYGRGGSRRHILRACDESLRRLGTDRIDLYQIHMQDLDTPEEETLRALDDLVRAGKVLYIGCSNYAAWRLGDALATAKAHGLHRYVSMQMQYNLVERGIEREHVPLGAAHGVGILPWSPLAGGFLSAKYDPGHPPPDGTRLAAWKDRVAGFDNPRCRSILDALRAVATAHGTTPAAVALAWLLRKPGVSSVIFGARTVAQLEANLAALSVGLGADDMAALDQASAFELGYPYTFIQRIAGRW